jgi:hypothetical protein
VVEIIPDNPGAVSGRGMIKIREDVFEVQLSVQTPGLVDKPFDFSVQVETRTMRALKEAIVKKMGLPRATVDRIKLSRRQAGSSEWTDVVDLADLLLSQNIVRIQDSDGCRNVYAKWSATIDKTPSLQWAFPKTATLTERLGGTYEGTRYFDEPKRSVVKNRKVIAIGIPTYNEQQHELRRTLESLNECVNHKLIDQNYGGQLYTCPVTENRLDGYYTTALIILDGLKVCVKL